MADVEALVRRTEMLMELYSFNLKWSAPDSDDAVRYRERLRGILHQFFALYRKYKDSGIDWKAWRNVPVYMRQILDHAFRVTST